MLRVRGSELRVWDVLGFSTLGLAVPGLGFRKFMVKVYGGL